MFMNIRGRWLMFMSVVCIQKCVIRLGVSVMFMNVAGMFMNASCCSCLFANENSFVHEKLKILWEKLIPGQNGRVNPGRSPHWPERPQTALPC